MPYFKPPYFMRIKAMTINTINGIAALCRAFGELESEIVNNMAIMARNIPKPDTITFPMSSISKVVWTPLEGEHLGRHTRLEG